MSSKHNSEDLDNNENLIGWEYILHKKSWLYSILQQQSEQTMPALTETGEAFDYTF